MGCCASYAKPKVVPDRWYPKFEEGLDRMEGKVVAVTGCTTGTGLVAARTMARLGATVLLLNRDSDRAEAALAQVRECASGANKEEQVVHVPCDLLNLGSVRGAVASIKERCSSTGLDVLLENAGIMAVKDEASTDGFDVQMQTNHLSHFLLTQGLMGALEHAAKERGEARVVIHSSIARNDGKKAGLREANLMKNGGGLGGNGMGKRWDRYSQTKWANMVFCHALHDKLQARGSAVKALVAHPGIAATNLQVTTVIDGGMPSVLASACVRQSAADGALGIVRAACAKDVTSCDFYGPVKGGFSGPAELLPVDNVPTESKDMLWRLSEQACGVTFAF